MCSRRREERQDSGRVGGSVQVALQWDRSQGAPHVRQFGNISRVNDSRISISVSVRLPRCLSLLLLILPFAYRVCLCVNCPGWTSPFSPFDAPSSLTANSPVSLTVVHRTRHRPADDSYCKRFNRIFIKKNLHIYLTNIFESIGFARDKSERKVPAAKQTGQRYLSLFLSFSLF